LKLIFSKKFFYIFSKIFLVHKLFFFVNSLACLKYFLVSKFLDMNSFVKKIGPFIAGVFLSNLMFFGYPQRHHQIPCERH